MDVGTANKYVVVHKLHMISPCLQGLNEMIISKSNGITRQVVIRSETAKESVKNVLMDCRRDLVISVTTQTVIFPISEAMIMMT